MLELAIRTFAAACLAALLAVAPAVADPETTGGLPAGVPPVLSPQGGLDGPHGTAGALAAQAGEEPTAAEEPTTTTTPGATAPESSTEGESTVVAPARKASPAQSSAAAADPAPTGGGGLPRTGFALAALVALGTGFFLTGYALRYSRTLDG